MLSLSELARRELPELCDFGANSKVESGFGYLGSRGEVLTALGAQLWINCRMTHVFSLFSLAGIDPKSGPTSQELAAHGIFSILRNFADPQHGGWFSWIGTELDSNGRACVNFEKCSRKEAYAHAFVTIAASSAFVAGVDGAAELLEESREIQDSYWWDESAGRVRESYLLDWTGLESYRGANANMHTVESYLAAFDATGDSEYLRRAALIAHNIINVSARLHGWRVPEHYTVQWQFDENYNRDVPTDPFRPWGATPGHGFEWARLCLQLWAVYESAGKEFREKLGLDLGWCLEAAAGLYDVAWQSWAVDGADGIVYTTDFSGQVISAQRMHWVACEAIGAGLCLEKAWSLLVNGGLSAGCRDCYGLDSDLVSRCQDNTRVLGDYVQNYLIEAPGRWFHELDVSNHRADLTWAGKPDIYHASQAMFLSDLPLTPGFAVALKRKY